MNKKKIINILKLLKNNKLSIDDALEKLKNISFEDIGFAKIDHNRNLRKDFPEVVFGKNKTAFQITEIIKKIIKEEGLVLVTKLNKNKADKIKKEVKECIYNEEAKMLYFKKTKHKNKGTVLIISAGTSDIPIAKESEITAKLMGAGVEFIYDVGVAGIHRLFACLDKIKKADVIIVVAGMEGALPTVVAGLVKVPVIAVPTSIGYGANFKGVSALLSMLNSCSPNVAVVNIDNGFGAGYIAANIIKTKDNN